MRARARLAACQSAVWERQEPQATWTPGLALSRPGDGLSLAGL